MRMQWIAAVLVSTAAMAACSDNGAQNQQKAEESQVAAPEPTPATEPVAPAPAPPVASPQGDNQAAPPRPSRTNPASSTQNRAESPRLSNSPAPSVPVTAPAPARARWREVTLPANTALALEITTALSSETATVEAPVQARLRTAVSVDGDTVLPAGTVLHGQVTDVERPGRVQGRSRLAVRFTEAQVNGEREALRTNPIVWEGEATKAEDATKIGAGAGVGAIIGGIIGGGDGAAKGAAIGGAAGTGAVLATRGRDVVIASGTDVSATLATPATIRVENR